MKNIIFNGMILDENPTGLGVFTKNVLDNIDKNKIKTIISHKKLNYSVKNTIVNIESKNKLKRIFLRNYKFNKVINNLLEDGDIIFSPTQHGVIRKNLNQIITIHDMIPLFYPQGRIHQYIYYKYILPKVIKNCKKIITVSNYTKKDLVEYYKIPSEKIEVVYNGYNKPKFVDIDKSIEFVKNQFDVDDYILMVGINYKYKNLHSVIKAYSDIETKSKLVIVGNYNVEYGRYLKRIVSEYGLDKKVIFLGYVSEEEKEMLYQASKFFIFPSLYEGFGLPVLEAMANKTPVLLSNSTSLPEVGGEAAVYFDSNNIDEIKRSLEYMFNLDETERRNLIGKGLKNIERFSWKKCGKQLSKIFDNI
ncbi:glycosyltransferase involved in cell wall biosynthesis [Clostridium moniliforme]|uniref:Glycosyltransferase involved in cell wall biosynthesis n=1 Tax=Clostridium moniliforme TaxID=39489 RepID=A0ABS4EYS1_9CLOT|nr:glycosyltransferase family 1 protein [Clostridium moniliforme]MBP1889140.1 glycosyltransferase involved in cell wall biosynthesis [Clostridium moniliforme]